MEVVGPAEISPEETVKTVWRLEEVVVVVGGAAAWDAGVVVEGGGGGGGTEKSARSCGSVSRISEVMSGEARRALVKIFGCGKLWLWGTVASAKVIGDL